RTPITFDVQGGRGRLQVGEVSYAELEPYKGPDGSTTVLSNTIFSTVPGAPVFVGKATRYRSKHVKLGHDLDMTGHNALQSTFVLGGWGRRRTGGFGARRTGWCRSWVA